MLSLIIVERVLRKAVVVSINSFFLVFICFLLLFSVQYLMAPAYIFYDNITKFSINAPNLLILLMVCRIMPLFVE